MGSAQGMLQQAVPSPRWLGSAVGLQPRFVGGSDLAWSVCPDRATSFPA